MKNWNSGRETRRFPPTRRRRRTKDTWCANYRRRSTTNTASEFPLFPQPADSWLLTTCTYEKHAAAINNTRYSLEHREEHAYALACCQQCCQSDDPRTFFFFLAFFVFPLPFVVLRVPLPFSFFVLSSRLVLFPISPSLSFRFLPFLGIETIAIKPRSTLFVQPTRYEIVGTESVVPTILFYKCSYISVLYYIPGTRLPSEGGTQRLVTRRRPLCNTCFYEKKLSHVQVKLRSNPTINNCARRKVLVYIPGNIY